MEVDTAYLAYIFVLIVSVFFLDFNTRRLSCVGFVENGSSVSVSPILTACFHWPDVR